MPSRAAILVAEDDTELRTVLCEQLERAGFKAYGVSDGIEALMQMEDAQWQAILTDYRMPHVDGMSLLGVVTACWPQTPVVMISADSSGRKAALKRGAFAWVQKPYDLESLLETMQQAVRRDPRIESTS
jgi:DNA-binding NtrC family response regulator